MKPVKIIAEIIITPEEFEKWCDGDILPTERMYHQFIEGTIYNKFGTTYDVGEYKNYINTTIDDNGLKITFEELEANWKNQNHHQKSIRKSILRTND